ncbi:hypothetical protein M8494_15870 [Serratia ureilytica]
MKVLSLPIAISIRQEGGRESKAEELYILFALKKILDVLQYNVKECTGEIFFIFHFLISANIAFANEWVFIEDENADGVLKVSVRGWTVIRFSFPPLPTLIQVL